MLCLHLASNNPIFGLFLDFKCSVALKCPVFVLTSEDSMLLV